MVVGAAVVNKEELHDDIITKVNQWFDRQIRNEEVLFLKFGANRKCTLNIDEMLSLFRIVTVDHGTALIQFNSDKTCTKIRIIIRP